MARAVKWAAAVALTVATFSLTVWVGLLVAEWIFPKAWPHSDKEAIVLAAASLLGTTTFGIGTWWAQRDSGQMTPAARPSEQRITGTFTGNSGITGNIIGGDANND